MMMYDWRASDAQEPHIDARPWKVEIAESSEDSFRIEATCPDGTERQVWIEIQDGKFVIHAYDPDHDEPVNLRISKTGITVDSDRDNGFQRHYDLKRHYALEGFVRQLANMPLPEEEYQDAGVPDADVYVGELDHERLRGEYETFMDIVRSARTVLG